MRQAAIDKAWRDCRNPLKKRLDVTSLVIKRNDTSQEIPISSRVNALLGENGAGKSTLLSTLVNLANLENPIPTLYLGSSITLKYNNKNFTLPYTQIAAAPLEAVDNTHPTFESIDTSRDAHTSTSYLKKQQNLAEYLLQFEFKTINQQGLLEFNAISGRSYSEIKIKEFESPLDPDDYLPYFSVKLSNGTEYDSLGMGFGELCTFIVIWRVSRCKSGHAILLDEPDSHLSPNARRRLADFLAIKAAEKELWIVFSTHSIESIENMSESELLLLARQDEDHSSPISVGNDKNEAFLRLGLTLSKRFLLLVEDVDSQELINQILQKYQPIIAQTCEVLPLIKGGEEIAKIVNDFPAENSVCRVIAVLDGDKSKTIATTNNIVFLPYDSDPIAAAKEWIQHHIEALAIRLQLSEDLIRTTAIRSAHVDHHDYCAEIANRLGLPGIQTKDVRRALISAWLSDQTVSNECEGFGRNLFNKIATSSLYRSQI